MHSQWGLPHHNQDGAPSFNDQHADTHSLHISFSTDWEHNQGMHLCEIRGLDTWEHRWQEEQYGKVKSYLFSKSHLHRFMQIRNSVANTTLGSAVCEAKATCQLFLFSFVICFVQQYLKAAVDITFRRYPDGLSAVVSTLLSLCLMVFQVSFSLFLAGPAETPGQLLWISLQSHLHLQAKADDVMLRNPNS